VTQWAVVKENRENGGHWSISCYVGGSLVSAPLPATKPLLERITGEEDPRKGPIS